ncbi:MAG TPA: hypothetical protein VF519_11925 [Mycobacteriales bacterium]|jgi:hypothetical protein
MNVRTAAALGVALAAISAGAADAAKVKPVCNLVVDATGDTFAARAQDGTAPGPQDDAFDIKSADIASDGKTITAAIRVAKLGDAQTSPQGRGFAFDFLLPTSDMQGSLRAVLITGQAPYFEATFKDPSVPNGPSTFISTVTGVVDAKKGEIRISAPVGVFSELGQIKLGTLITPAADAATSGRAVPPAPGVAGAPITTRYVFADVATDSKPYKAGTPSCVPVGK